MPRRLADKVVLVVGAGSVGEGWGNGKAAAVLYAREGAKVFAVDLRLEAAEETAAIIASEGGACTVHAADVTRADDVAATVSACLDGHGRIDVLHNNVGGSLPGGPVEMEEADWNSQLQLNLTSAFLTCKHVLPVMERHGRGAIVNVSSVAALRHLGRDMVAYESAKAALIQFTRAVALKYAREGIRANCVVPGLMYTPLVAVRIAQQYGGGDVDKTVEARHAACPMGHMGDAWDVAHAALYLASDEAKYVTATEIVVDGGLTARCI